MPAVHARRLIGLLAALTALVLTSASSALATAGAQNGVRAFSSASQARTGQVGLESSCTRPGSAGRPRKRIDITIAGFAQFAVGKPDVRLYLHMGMTDLGWDVPELARRHGIMDKLIVTHEGDLHPGSSPEQLNRIYNACDVGINTSEAESWGLTAFEHAATGAAQIVPGHTGTREIWEGAAEMLSPIMQLTSPGSLTESALIDPQTVAATLERLYQNPELLEARSLSAYQHATQTRYSWDTVAQSFDTMLSDLAHQHASDLELARQEQSTVLTGPRGLSSLTSRNGSRSGDPKHH